MRSFFLLLLLCTSLRAQGLLGDTDITNVFEGVDISSALEKLEAQGKTPYQFGMDLLHSGHPDKAKEWFVAVGIETKDVQYVYGLAFVKWATGDTRGAVEDCGYILSKNPTPIVLARTQYMLGSIGVDNQDFESARRNLLKALDTYRELGKNGGMYLCYSMMALNAVYQKNFDAVEPLLEKAREHNLLIAKPYSEGRYYEILSEMHFLKGNYTVALLTAQESQDRFTEAGMLHLADEVQARVGLLLLLDGQSQAAYAVSSKLWEKFHTSRDRGRLLAYNAITLMKLSLCAGNTEDAQDKERAALAWAKSTTNTNNLVRTLNWVKGEKNFPCPAWR